MTVNLDKKGFFLFVTTPNVRILCYYITLESVGKVVLLHRHCVPLQRILRHLVTAEYHSTGHISLPTYSHMVFIHPLYIRGPYKCWYRITCKWHIETFDPSFWISSTSLYHYSSQHGQSFKWNLKWMGKTVISISHTSFTLRVIFWDQPNFQWLSILRLFFELRSLSCKHRTVWGLQVWIPSGPVCCAIRLMRKSFRT